MNTHIQHAHPQTKTQTRYIVTAGHVYIKTLKSYTSGANSGFKYRRKFISTVHC